MAEAVFAHKAAAAGLSDRFLIDSAGTGSWHIGQPPHSGTRKELARHNIPTTHRARVVTEQDLADFDYILTMDDSNFDDVNALGIPKGKLRRFVEYDSSTGYQEVPDPYYTGHFDEVYDLVDKLSDGLLQTIREEQKI
jgi:protein-tyrosine phosphatase